MSNNHFSWFHCGHCDLLFQALPGEAEDRVCSKCGRDPSLGIESKSPDRLVQAIAVASVSTVSSTLPHKREASTSKKGVRSYFMVKLITGWLLLLAIIVGASRLIWPSESNKGPFVSSTPPKVIRTAADAALLEEVIPLLNETFAGFISAGTPELRNQFVLNPIDTAARMARFYELNPQVTIAPESLTLVHASVLKLPEGRAIETNWSSKDGRQIDAVFVEQDKEWLLDWDHFARFSTYPWALFVAGSGESEGEFRLLARQRLADERKDADSISMVLYAPRFGAPAETGFQSPEFLVKRDTRGGRLLDAAFKLEASGKRVFGLDIPNPNPEGLIRVRVKVRRTEGDQSRSFELLEVISCHWYSVDDPGVEVSEAPTDQ